jgi:hypothetical protein
MRRLTLCTVLVLAGCTVIIAPRPKTGVGQSLVYLSYNSGTGLDPTASPTGKPLLPVDSHNVPLAGTNQVPIDPQCVSLNTPTIGTVPDMKILSSQERKDKDKVENTLVDYILSLRTFITTTTVNDGKFFKDYQIDCKTVTPSVIK